MEGENCVSVVLVCSAVISRIQKQQQLVWIQMVGSIRSDNHAIQVIDRIKNIFKLSQGEYIAVEKVENVYLQNDLIDQICVYGDSNQNYIVAVVVPNQKKLIAFMNASSVSDAVKQLEYAKMCEHKEVRKILLEELNKTALAANVEIGMRMKCSYLVLNEFAISIWSQQSGQLITMYYHLH